MPLLKMKTKSTTGSKEKGFLHVCQKSNVISKSPLSRLRVSENVEKIRSPDEFLNVPAAPPGEVADATNCCNASVAEKHFHKQPPNVTESVTEDNMELSLSMCLFPSDSPVLGSMDFITCEGRDNIYVPQLEFEESDDSSKSSTERPLCSNISEFDISDVIFSSPTTGNNSIFDNKADIVSALDDESDESSLVCDLSEECTRLPMLDDNLDARRNDDTKPPEETVLHSDFSRLHMAIHQLKKTYSQDSYMNGFHDQDYVCSDPCISNLRDQLDMASNFSGPTETPRAKRITLVLDLDETLVHSTVVPCDDADFAFTISPDEKKYTVYVKQRPHLHDFLQKVSKMFEVVVFTASQSIYAKPLLDILDPDGTIISRRAYRESCNFSGANYIKDLTVLGVDLAKVAIIDNSPQVFSLQINNGIPIETWFDDPSDCALISLLPFLETLANADDVRPIIARKFSNKTIE